jgi:hypothetical protein
MILSWTQSSPAINTCNYAYVLGVNILISEGQPVICSPDINPQSKFWIVMTRGMRSIIWDSQVASKLISSSSCFFLMILL